MSIRRCSTVASAALLAVVAAGASAPALAWGPQGHAIVADIAQAQLTPVAAAEVKRLLALEKHTHLDQISSWADANRKKMPDTGPWHYVDIPLDAAGYDAKRDCHDDDCIVPQLVKFAHVLADPKAPDAKRLTALKWVVHLVGDIHQPLHAEDDDDKGGNTVQLHYFGQGTNLHAVWDEKIIEHALGVQLGPNYSFDHGLMRHIAAGFAADVTPVQRDVWAPAGMLEHLDARVIGWANASHAIAQDVAYADLPAKRKHGWATSYQARTWPVVKAQLQRGGMRLGELLNEALSAPAHKAD